MLPPGVPQEEAQGETEDEDEEEEEEEKEKQGEQDEGDKNGSKPCPFQHLPDEMVLAILAQLPIESLGACKAVCWHWNQVLSSTVGEALFASRAQMFVVMLHNEGDYNYYLHHRPIIVWAYTRWHVWWDLVHCYQGKWDSLLVWKQQEEVPILDECRQKWVYKSTAEDEARKKLFRPQRRGKYISWPVLARFVMEKATELMGDRCKIDFHEVRIRSVVPVASLPPS
jgi:hypothetical protein